MGKFLVQLLWYWTESAPHLVGKGLRYLKNFCANVSTLWLHPRVVSIYYKKEKKTEDISTWSTKIFHLCRTRLIVSNSISLCMFPCSKYQWIETTYIKTGYLKRSQCCELAILRPFLAIFSQTAVRTFTKVNFWRTFWGAKHI